MAGVKITELTQVTSSSDSDLLVIEQSGGTKSIEKSDFLEKLSFTSVSISGTPSALGSTESWDSSSEYGYYLDITLTDVTSDMIVTSFVAPISLMKQIAPFVQTGTNYLRIFLKTSATISSTLISVTLEGV